MLPDPGERLTSLKSRRLQGAMGTAPTFRSCQHRMLALELRMLDSTWARLAVHSLTHDLRVRLTDGQKPRLSVHLFRNIWQNNIDVKVSSASGSVLLSSERVCSRSKHREGRTKPTRGYRDGSRIPPCFSRDSRLSLPGLQYSDRRSLGRSEKTS